MALLLRLNVLNAGAVCKEKIDLVFEDSITVADYLPFTQEGDDIHEAWYPLLKMMDRSAILRRNRYIGIKSQVDDQIRDGITTFQGYLEREGWAKIMKKMLI